MVPEEGYIDIYSGNLNFKITSHTPLAQTIIIDETYDMHFFGMVILSNMNTHV